MQKGRDIVRNPNVDPDFLLELAPIANLHGSPAHDLDEVFVGLIALKVLVNDRIVAVQCAIR